MNHARYSQQAVQLTNQTLFYVGLDRFIVHDVFLSVFLVDLLLQIRMGRSTRSRLDVSASLGLFQYWCVCSYINNGIHIIFIVYSHINYLFAGYFYMYLWALLSNRGTTVPWGEKLVVIAQVSQGIHPEVHSRRICRDGRATNWLGGQIKHLSMTSCN